MMLAARSPAMSEGKISITENVCWRGLTGALISVSLVTVVASARLATVGVVGASSVSVAWVGGVTDIT